MGMQGFGGFCNILNWQSAQARVYAVKLLGHFPNWDAVVFGHKVRLSTSWV